MSVKSLYVSGLAYKQRIEQEGTVTPLKDLVTLRENICESLEASMPETPDMA